MHVYEYERNGGHTGNENSKALVKYGRKLGVLYVFVLYVCGLVKYGWERRKGVGELSCVLVRQ